MTKLGSLYLNRLGERVSRFKKKIIGFTNSFVCMCVYMCVRAWCVCLCVRVFFIFFPDVAVFLYSVPSRGGRRKRRGEEGGKKKTRQNSTVPEKSFLSTSENRAEQLPRSAQDTLLLQFLGLRLVVGKTLRLPGRALLHVGGKGGGSDILDGHLLQ